jgi:hypothetical protein
MGAREAAYTRGGMLAIAAAVALGLGACGGEEDFANEPRPAAPINLSASVDSERVNISPDRVGAGLAELTVANLSDQAVRVMLIGPGSDDNPATDEIPAGGVGNLRTDLAEGDYEVAAQGADVMPDRLTVGPPRPGSEHELLLP